MFLYYISAMVAVGDDDSTSGLAEQLQASLLWKLEMVLTQRTVINYLYILNSLLRKFLFYNKC